MGLFWPTYRRSATLSRWRESSAPASPPLFWDRPRRRSGSRRSTRSSATRRDRRAPEAHANERRPPATEAPDRRGLREAGAAACVGAGDGPRRYRPTSKGRRPSVLAHRPDPPRPAATTATGSPAPGGARPDDLTGACSSSARRCDCGARKPRSRTLAVSLESLPAAPPRQRRVPSASRRIPERRRSARESLEHLERTRSTPRRQVDAADGPRSWTRCVDDAERDEEMLRAIARRGPWNWRDEPPDVRRLRPQLHGATWNAPRSSPTRSAQPVGAIATSRAAWAMGQEQAAFTQRRWPRSSGSRSAGSGRAASRSGCFDLLIGDPGFGGAAASLPGRAHRAGRRRADFRRGRGPRRGDDPPTGRGAGGDRPRPAPRRRHPPPTRSTAGHPDDADELNDRLADQRRACDRRPARGAPGRRRQLLADDVPVPGPAPPARRAAELRGGRGRPPEQGMGATRSIALAASIRSCPPSIYICSPAIPTIRTERRGPQRVLAHVKRDVAEQAGASPAKSRRSPWATGSNAKPAITGTTTTTASDLLDAPTAAERQRARRGCRLPASRAGREGPRVCDPVGGDGKRDRLADGRTGEVRSRRHRAPSRRAAGAVVGVVLTPPPVSPPTPLYPSRRGVQRGWLTSRGRRADPKTATPEEEGGARSPGDYTKQTTGGRRRPLAIDLPPELLRGAR